MAVALCKTDKEKVRHIKDLVIVRVCLAWLLLWLILFPGQHRTMYLKVAQIKWVLKLAAGLCFSPQIPNALALRRYVSLVRFSLPMHGDVLQALGKHNSPEEWSKQFFVPPDTRIVCFALSSLERTNPLSINPSG